MKKWARILFGAGLGALLGSQVSRFIEHEGPGALTTGEAWALLGLTFLGFFLAVFLHECGHALGARAKGWRFHFLAVGPLWLERGPQGLRLRLNRLPKGHSGMALCVPSDRASLERGLAWFYAGGPLASFLWALANGAVFWAIGPEQGGLVGPTAAIWGLTSLLIGLVTALVPGRDPANDGQRLLRWLRRDPRALAEAAMLLQVTPLAMAGVRPREWPADALELLQLDPSQRGQQIHQWILAAVEWDRGQRAEALDRIEALGADWESFPPSLRCSLALDLALLGGLQGRPQAEVERWLEKSRGGFVEAWKRSAVEAQLALLRGNQGQARAKLAAAGSQLERGWAPANDGARELLLELERGLESSA